MDLIAKLTRYAFTGNQPPTSFTDHWKWFVEKKPDVDPGYRSFLENNLAWYDELKLRRDQVTHHSALEVRIRADEAGLRTIASTGITRTEGDFIDIQELCTKIQRGLQEFLCFFDQHFAGRL